MRNRFTAAPTGAPEHVVMLSTSLRAAGPTNIATQRGAGTSAVWNGANIAIFFPFYLTEARTYTGMIWMNGAAVSGNVNGAIYSADGTTALATIGSVAQAGTTATQQKAFPSPITLAPGLSWMALVCDNTTGAFVQNGTNLQSLRAIGVRRLGSFFALTASAAGWSGTTVAWMPIFGLYEASWL